MQITTSSPLEQELLDQLKFLRTYYDGLRDFWSKTYSVTTVCNLVQIVHRLDTIIECFVLTENRYENMSNEFRKFTKHDLTKCIRCPRNQRKIRPNYVKDEVASVRKYFYKIIETIYAMSVHENFPSSEREHMMDIYNYWKAQWE